MIHLYCGKRGTGKSKALIKLANEKVEQCRGTLVYIDDDSKMAFSLHRDVRFISTQEYNLKSCSDFYGFICGIISKDYDLEDVFVDGLFNIISENLEKIEGLLERLQEISNKNNFNIHMNITVKEEIPEFFNKYNLDVKG